MSRPGLGLGLGLVLGSRSDFSSCVGPGSDYGRVGSDLGSVFDAGLGASLGLEGGREGREGVRAGGRREEGKKGERRKEVENDGGEMSQHTDLVLNCIISVLSLF